MSLEHWSYIAAIIGGATAVIGFPLLWWQLYEARSQRQDAMRLSTSQVLLAADAVIATYADVAAKLRGGEWSGENGRVHPKDDEERALVEPYMGVFERVFIAYRAGQVNEEILDELYFYRLWNIWANHRIVEDKLENPELRESWKRFIALSWVLEAHRGQRFPLHNDTYFPAELFDARKAREVLQKVPPPRRSSTG